MKQANFFNLLHENDHHYCFFSSVGSKKGNERAEIGRKNVK
jgi:hypothetical protein